MTRRGSLRRLRWPVTAAFIAAAPVPLGAAPAAAAPVNAVPGGTSTLAEMLTGGALLLCAIAGLAVVLRLRSRRGGGNRRTPTDAGAAAPGGDWFGGSSVPGASGAHGPGAGPVPGDGERSSRAASAAEPDWPYPDHPSWPAGSTGRPLTPDHPSWPAGGLGRPIGYRRPRGTATDSPYSDHPSWPAGGLDRPVASNARPGRPAAGLGGPWPASAGGQPADDGPSRPQPEPAGASPSPAMDHGQYPRPSAPHVPRARGRHVRVPAGYSGYPRPGVPTGNAPQWAAAEAVPVREAAAREVAEIRDQAAAQVAAIREAADREIAELRATVLALSDELRRVAAYVTENVTSPGQPTVPPPPAN